MTDLEVYLVWWQQDVGPFRIPMPRSFIHPPPRPQSTPVALSKSPIAAQAHLCLIETFPGFVTVSVIVNDMIVVLGVPVTSLIRIVQLPKAHRTIFAALCRLDTSATLPGPGSHWISPWAFGAFSLASYIDGLIESDPDGCRRHLRAPSSPTPTRDGR